MPGGGGGVCFLLTDAQCDWRARAFMLEDVSLLLGVGDVGAFFADGDARAELVECARRVAAGPGATHRQSRKFSQLTNAEVFSRFACRVRARLHFVVCLGAVGTNVHEHLERFPALLSRCAVDWYSQWPQQALLAAARQRLGGTALLAGDLARGDGSSDDEEAGEAATVEKLAHVAAHVHAGARRLSALYLTERRRRSYVTPATFLQLLACYRALLEREGGVLHAQRARYLAGLERLRAAEKDVTRMRRQLEAFKPVLTAKTDEAAALVAEMAAQARAAEKVKLVVTAEEKIALEDQAVTKAIRDECNAELDTALPQLNAAVEALKTLKAGDMEEVKTFKNPPEKVKLTMEAVCIMVGVLPVQKTDPRTQKKVHDYWLPAVKLLSNAPHLLQQLQEYDKHVATHKCACAACLLPALPRAHSRCILFSLRSPPNVQG